ncbi:MAG TPA: GNAT family N-acetyltransferase [Ktedonobacteraceae bacterium]|jgi:GNAT superfamily N-acetyltransferase
MQRSIRVVTVADLEIADTITMEAYQLSYSRKAELQRYLDLQPDGWHMALLGEQPAAFGGIVNYGSFSYVGMVGVLPTLQHYGLGTFIMESLLSWAEQHYCPTILLDASDAGVNLYRKLGFVEDDKVLLLSLLEPPVRSALLPANISELQAQEIPELAAFDAPYFGAERARVFQRLFQEYPNRAFVSRHPSGSVTGYLFAQERTLGPWIAQTSTDAENLLLSAFSLSFDTGMPYVLVSPMHQQALALLQRYGFRQQRQLSHMRLGPSLPRQRTMIYGQASFALG